MKAGNQTDLVKGLLIDQNAFLLYSLIDCLKSNRVLFAAFTFEGTEAKNTKRC